MDIFAKHFRQFESWYSNQACANDAKQQRKHSDVYHNNEHLRISTQDREMTKKCTSDGLAISSNFDGSDIFLSAHFVRIRLWELEEFQRNRVLYRHIISM